jgi:hypothetical protein
MFHDHQATKSLFHYIMNEFTCINEDVKPSYSTICSVSTKFAVSPSRFAPLLHILVPAVCVHDVLQLEKSLKELRSDPRERERAT